MYFNHVFKSFKSLYNENKKIMKYFKEGVLKYFKIFKYFKVKYFIVLFVHP